jgi:hypothetical protein
MAKRENVAVDSVTFVKTFAVMAKQGKSALDIGRSLGLRGSDEKVSLMVSAKASMLRKRLKESALAEATGKGWDKEKTEAYVSMLGNKLPRIKSKGRPSEVGELVDAIDSVLAELDAPSAEVEDAEEVTDDLEVVE